MLRHDGHDGHGVGGRARRVMWRQADNPLAPGDKYEVCRTFSAARLHSVSRGEKKKGGARHARPLSRREVTQSSDYSCNWQTLSSPIRRYANIFFLPTPHFLSRHLRPTGEGGAMRIEIADNSSGHGKLVQLQPADRLFRKLFRRAPHHASSLLFILPIFPARCIPRVVRLRCKYSWLWNWINLQRRSVRREWKTGKRNDVYFARVLSRW